MAKFEDGFCDAVKDHETTLQLLKAVGKDNLVLLFTQQLKYQWSGRSTSLHGVKELLRS